VNTRIVHLLYYYRKKIFEKLQYFGKKFANITRSLHSFLVFQERYQKHICIVKFKIFVIEKSFEID